VNRLNCVGDICPVPVIKTKKAMLSSQGAKLEVLVDNEIAVQNISKYLKSVGCTFSASQENGNFLISINGNAADAPQTEPALSGLVVIPSEFMGTGDDTLGKLLIKGFIFALSQLETLPEAIVFYNGGVRHVLKDSAGLNDLQNMQASGVKILACGTCLNHFGVLDQLAVGEVTDMYNIVNLMQRAVYVIRP